MLDPSPIHRISRRLISSTLLAAALLAAGCRTTAEAPVPTPADTRDPARIATDAPKAVRSRGGVVVSATGIASRIGRDVLASGGNAVDAAIATGFALAVTHPTAGNIGGGGFMVIRFPDGRTTTFNFREKAPLRAHPEMFLDSAGKYSSRIHHDSHLAVGVPGTVAGFALAHERYGSKPWRELVEPAVRLARDGFPVMPGLARSLRAVLPSMQRYPASVAAFSKNGTPYEPGEIWKQPDLART
ncbi:MAG TPA: gamma-glutamyltransferase, partial [Longimicrobiales bacterium]